MALTPPRQTAVGFTSGAGTATATFSSSVLPGSLLVLLVSSGSSSTPSTPTESLSETVLNAVAWAGNATQGLYMGMWYVQNTAGGTISFSATSSYTVVLCAEYPGIAAVALDQGSVVATGSGAIATNSLTPAASGELAVASLSIVGGLSSWGGSFADENSQSDGVNTLHLGDWTATAAAVQATATSSGGGQWTAALALFKPLSGNVIAWIS